MVKTANEHFPFSLSISRKSDYDGGAADGGRDPWGIRSSPTMTNRTAKPSSTNRKRVGQKKRNSPFYTMPNYRPLKKKLMKAQDHRCNYCGDKLKFGRGSHMDHIVAKARGGSDRKDNMCLTCAWCNTTKSYYTLKQWRYKLQERVNGERRYRYWPRMNEGKRRRIIARLTEMIGAETPSGAPRPQASHPAAVVAHQPPARRLSTIHKLMEGLSS